MADFQTLNLGQIMQTAAALKADQRAAQDDVLRQKYLGTQIAGAQQEQQQSATNFQTQQDIAGARQAYLQAGAILQSADPVGTAKLYAPKLVQAYEQQKGPGSFAQASADEVKQFAQKAQPLLAAHAGIQPEIAWQDTGSTLTPIDKLTGHPIAGLSPVSKSASPDAQLSATTTRRGQDMTAATAKAEQAVQLQTKGVPEGYERDPNNPGALRPMIGGPHDPNATSAGMDSRSSVMFNRVAASANEAVTSLKNIAELPVTTSSGWFGGAQPATTLMGSVKSVLGQKVTSQEAQDYKTMIAGVSRSLSTIETAGLAPNGSITHSMDSITLNEGDSQLTKLRKLAETRQIIEKGIEPNLSNPKLAPAQRDLVNRIISDVQGAIPFTQHDITKLQQSKNPNATLMDFAGKTGLPTAPAQPGAAPAAASAPAAAVPRNISALLDKYK